MPFQLLPYKNLSDNTAKLLENVFKKHSESGKELVGKRNDQVALIASVVDRLKIMGQEPSELAQKQSITKEFKDIVERNVALSRQIRELKNIKERSEAQEELLAKLTSEKEKLDKEREAIKKFKNATLLDRNSDEQQAKFISSEQNALILTGALIAVKAQIDYEYSGITNKMLSYAIKNDATNSALYSGIDEAIGISQDNPLDDDTKKKALAAYNQYISMTEELKNFDRNKMKKVKTVEKDHLYIYEPHANVVENGHADRLLDTAAEKERYRQFVNSQQAYEGFLANTKAQIEAFDKSKLKHVETEVKSSVSLVSEPDFAKLPNGQNAKNKIIHDNEDPTTYMKGVDKPADRNGAVVHLSEKDQLKAFQQVSLFFNKGGVNDQLKSGNKLKHVTPEAKQPDPNVVKYQKRF